MAFLNSARRNLKLRHVRDRAQWEVYVLEEWEAWRAARSNAERTSRGLTAAEAARGEGASHSLTEAGPAGVRAIEDGVVEDVNIERIDTEEASDCLEDPHQDTRC